MTAEKHILVKKNTDVPSVGGGISLTKENLKGLKIKEKTFTKTAKSKTPMPVGTIFMAVICTLLLMFIVFVGVQVSDYSSQVSDLSRELKGLIEKEEALNFELSQKNDLNYIEQQAQAMGMVKEDKLPKKYVAIAGDDASQVLIAEKEEDAGYSLSGILSALGESFGEILEYIKD